MTGLSSVRALALTMLVVGACGRDAVAEGGDGASAAALVPASVATIDTARADSAAFAAVRARYPRAQVRAPEVVVAVPGTAYRSGTLSFATEDERAYGAIVAVWTADDGRLVWTHEQPGDFPPHRLVWLDADRDGQKDLFFTAGEETVFETYLFVNRTHRNPPSPDSAFVLAYRSGNDYTTLLDLDGDGHPELIDSGYPGEEHVNTEVCSDRPPSPGVLAQAQQEYARRVGPFGAANFEYGSDNFGMWTLHMLDPIRILQLHQGRTQEVTLTFADHLRWRRDVLQAYRAEAGEACRAHIDRIISHLRGGGS